MKRSSLSAVQVMIVAAVLCAPAAPAAEVRAKAPKVATPKFSPPTAGMPAHDLVAGWEGIPIVYLPNGPRLTAFAHDDRFLYVHFRFGDLALARRIARAGVIVWVNGEAHHAARLGYRYHGSEALLEVIKKQAGPEEEPDPEGNPYEEARRGGSDDHKPKAPPGALEVFKDDKVVEVIDGGVKEDGPAAASAVDDGAYAYELRVPLASLTDDPGKPPEKIAVGFQMTGLRMAEMDDGRGRDGIDDVPGGDGFGGTSQRRTSRSRRVGPRIDLLSIQWVDVDLLPTPPRPAKPSR